MPTLRWMFFMLCVLCAGQSCARTLTVAADPWCPFNCTPGSSNQGYMVDMLIDILSVQGYQVKYIVLPWSRAIRDAEFGAIDGVIAAGEEDGTKLLLHKTPIGMSVQGFATRKGESFDWQSVNSIGTRRLELIKNYDYGDEIKQWAAQHPEQIDTSVGENPLETSFKKLLAKRSDVVINNGAVMSYTLQQMDLLEAFSIKPTGKNVPLFIGLSPKIKDAQALAELIDKGVDSMRKSGKLSQLLKKYGLQDWDPKSR